MPVSSKGERIKDKRKPLPLLFLRVVVVFFIFNMPLCSKEGGHEHIIVIDPGHGGTPRLTADDKWDPISKRYLEGYSYGMVYRNHEEHQLMYDLALRVVHYLKLTQSRKGWVEFQEILKFYSDETNFQRANFKVHLSRPAGWRALKLSPDDPDGNVSYRLYDFPSKDNPKKMSLGRISAINELTPELVVSLHMNPAGYGHKGGMAAVLTPGFATFDLIRKIHLKQKKESSFYALPITSNWLLSQDGWNLMESARADAWVYFHGYWSSKDGTRPLLTKNRGIRYNMVQWRYRDPDGWEKRYNPNIAGQYALKYSDFKPIGLFFDRERSLPEEWRREGGPLKFGGDNHYAADELMRFVQYGLRRMSPSLQKSNGIGPIQPPYASAYSVPAFMNAISAYIEIGYLNRDRDYRLVTRHRDEVAKSLAAGIYSLFYGLKVKHHVSSPYYPSGNPLPFDRYRNYKDGNYFKLVLP